MEKLIIMDYTTGSVHCYDYDREEDVTEDYIESLGYPCNNCLYMVGELEIVFHKEVLK